GRGRDIRFTLVSPRTAALKLRENLTSALPDGSNLLRVTLSGTNPQRLTAIMQALVDEFVATAADLKTRNLVEVARTLEKQLDVASKDLRDAENSLESFRVHTITLPTEASPPPAAARAVATSTTPSAGAAAANDDIDPGSDNFFAEQRSYDAIH